MKVEGENQQKSSAIESIQRILHNYLIEHHYHRSPTSHHQQEETTTIVDPNHPIPTIVENRQPGTEENREQVIEESKVQTSCSKAKEGAEDEELEPEGRLTIEEPKDHKEVPKDHKEVSKVSKDHKKRRNSGWREILTITKEWLLHNSSL